MMSATPAPSGDATPGRRRGWRPDGRLPSRIRGLLHWWGAALATWLPAYVRDLLGLAGRRLLLQVEGDTLALSLYEADASHALARVPLAPLVATGGDPLGALLAPRVAEAPRRLLLPARAGLRRRLTLPEAAGDRLRDVLGFEIDRQTPFAASDVLYDHRVLARRADGQLDVELVVVPRATVESQLAALGALRGTLAGVDLDGGHGPLGINLIRDARRREDPQRRYRGLLVAGAVVCTGLALWQILHNRAAAVDALAQRIDALARPAREASAQRQQLADLREGMAFLEAQRAARPRMVAVLDALAQRLPDSTSLEKAAIEGDRVLLIGLSTEASALVGHLEGSPLWRSPALAGALQNDPRVRADRFTLTAELASPSTADAGEGARADAR